MSLISRALFSLFTVSLVAAATAVGCGESTKGSGSGNGDGDGDGDGDSDGDGNGDGDGDGLGGGGNQPATLICSSDKDCRDRDQICDTSRLVCVDCLTQADCGENALCQNSVCISITPCASSKDCSVDQVCATDLGYCVECLGDNDCGTDQKCVAHSCRDACGSDKDCRDTDGVCNITEGICVECVGDPDCPSDAFCGPASTCLPQVCNPGSAVCTGDDLSTCDTRGDGFSTSTCEEGCNNAGTACTASGPCTTGDMGCECYPNDTCNGTLTCASGLCVNPGGCAVTTDNLCTTIVKFSGTQTVDGDDTDFCDVPATVVNFANAEFTNVTRGTTDTSISEATVRVAWDETALRAYVHVKDPNIAHAGGVAYNGDNLQFFISSAPPSSGTTDITPGVSQIYVVPAAGGTPALVEYYGDSPSTLPVTSPSYYTDVVSDGYVVEMLWPWRGTPPTSGSQIGFNVLIGVEDDGPGRDFEYAYALKSVSLSNCGSNQAPWCDMRHWCSPTLQP